MATRDDQGYRDDLEEADPVDDAAPAPPALMPAAQGDDATTYLIDMLPELAAIAERSGMDLVAYLLTMARIEVEEQRRRSVM